MLALIMAGGLGTRFWPKSRQDHPKHLLRVLGKKTLIQNTVSRLNPLISPEQTFVVSTDSQLEKIRAQLPGVPAGNVIAEPMGKNTAPCIGLAALYMQRIDPDAVMVVLPADHIVDGRKLFHKTLQVARKVAAETDCIVTIGVEPDYPSTGYGYIQSETEVDCIDGLSLYTVKTFAEKPNLATAQRFLQSGDFLWNSGIFIWKIKTILAEIEEHLPQVHDGLMEIKAVLGTAKEESTKNRVYRQIRSVSIDYGVMEAAKNVKVLKAKFGWNDLGSWDQIYKLHEKDENDNVLVGDHLVTDSRGCFVDAEDRSVALVGLDNVIVVDTGDAVLVCSRDQAQNVKSIVDLARRKKKKDLL